MRTLAPPTQTPCKVWGTGAQRRGPAPATPSEAQDGPEPAPLRRAGAAGPRAGTRPTCELEARAARDPEARGRQVSGGRGAARWARAGETRAAAAGNPRRARGGETGRGRARDAELGRLPQTAPGTPRLTGRGSAERLARDPVVSARPPSLPCMLLTAGWPGAEGPMGPGVPPPPPEPPPPPLGVGAAIVGSEEPSGAAAAAMQQARPLAPLRARRAPPWPRPGHASDTPPPVHAPARADAQPAIQAELPAAPRTEGRACGPGYGDPLPSRDPKWLAGSEIFVHLGGRERPTIPKL